MPFVMFLGTPTQNRGLVTFADQMRALSGVQVDPVHVEDGNHWETFHGWETISVPKGCMACGAIVACQDGRTNMTGPVGSV
mmetsp:Transcript_766/g.2314  ORF Transcript_766/g.2314 Transcript_766/m.2314 type:complete len:81 (-) Transcript_766:2396-2638(-)